MRKEFDVDFLMSIADGDVTFANEIVQEYLSDGEGLLEQIETAASQGDADAVSRVAHTLKGSSRTVGAVTVATLSEQLEAEAKTGNTGMFPSLLTDLRSALCRLKDGYLEELPEAA